MRFCWVSSNTTTSDTLLWKLLCQKSTDPDKVDNVSGLLLAEWEDSNDDDQPNARSGVQRGPIHIYKWKTLHNYCSELFYYLVNNETEAALLSKDIVNLSRYDNGWLSFSIYTVLSDDDNYVQEAYVSIEAQLTYSRKTIHN